MTKVIDESQEMNTATVAPRAFSEEQALDPGTRVADYVVVRLLGAGGCARVYEAKHVMLGRRVALKVLNPDLAMNPQMVQRFVREAQVVNRIHHPNVADIYDFGTLPDGRPYFFMEYLDGPSLSRELIQRGRLAPEEVSPFLQQLASALEAAHAEGVVHRDVKASNVVVLTNPPRVKLLDFGIAKLLHPEPGEVPLTTETQSLGSPPYMSPEQILGKAIDGRSDQYSLGVLAFLGVTGSMPFWSKDPIEMLRMHLDVQPPRPSSLVSLPPGLDAVILQALAKAPDDRFKSVSDFAQAFRDAVFGPELNATPAVARSRGAQGCGVSVEAHFPDEVADRQLELAADALEKIEAALSAAGFQTFLQTSQSLLCLRPLSDEPTESAATLRDTTELVSRLQWEHGEALIAVGVRLTQLVHCDEVDIRLGTTGVKVTGGPLTRTADWPISAQHGWYATAPVIEHSRKA